MTGPARVDAVSPAMAPTVTPTLAPRLREQPQKTMSKLTALGARWSRGWEAGSGGATPLPAIVGVAPPEPARLSLDRRMPTPIMEASPKPCPVSAQCRSRAGPNRDALVLYTRFIGAAVDYVLNRLIETRLVTDRDFAAWHNEHRTEVMCSADARRRIRSASINRCKTRSSTPTNDVTGSRKGSRIFGSPDAGSSWTTARTSPRSR